MSRDRVETQQHRASPAPGSGNGTNLLTGVGVPQEVGPAAHQGVPKVSDGAGVADAAVGAGDGHAGSGRARGDGVDTGVRVARLLGRLTARAADHRARAEVVFAGVPRGSAATLEGEGKDGQNDLERPALSTAAAPVSPRRALQVNLPRGSALLPSSPSCHFKIINYYYIYNPKLLGLAHCRWVNWPCCPVLAPRALGTQEIS